MTTTAYLENVLIDALCDLAAIAMIPVQMLSGLLWVIVAGCTLLWRIRYPVAATVAAVGFVAFCMTYPLFIVGLLIVGAYAYVTYPK